MDKRIEIPTRENNTDDTDPALALREVLSGLCPRDPHQRFSAFNVLADLSIRGDQNPHLAGNITHIQEALRHPHPHDCSDAFQTLRLVGACRGCVKDCVTASGSDPACVGNA